MDGDEYLNTFAQAIPDWQSTASRATIRTWFGDFARRYRGFHPTGRWSPALLDHRLANRTCDLFRATFKDILPGISMACATRWPTSLTSPSESSARPFKLAGIMRAHPDFNIFSIKRNSLEDWCSRLLATKIVQDTVPAIQPQTLTRLVTDLERRQSARDWLREARKVLREARMRESIRPGF